MLPRVLPLAFLLALLASCGDSSDADRAAGAGADQPTLPLPDGPAGEPADQPAAGPPGFADESFKPVPRESAVYRIERQFVEQMMLVEGVPTYDQGMGLKASATPLDRYTFNYYRLDDDSLAFSVDTTVLREDTSQSIWSGMGLWYDRDLNPTARGTFEGGKLHGEYQQLDPDGNVVSTERYDKGATFDPNRFAAAVHRPLVGEWHCDTSSGSTVSRLINRYTDDGLVTLQTIRFVKDRVLGGKDGLRESSRTDPTTWSWKYAERDDKSGNIEFFEGNKLVGRSRLTFPSRDTLTSRITYHQSPSMVGKRYSFKRVN